MFNMCHLDISYFQFTNEDRSSPNLIENDHNFVFFDYKVSTQQHFESHLFWKSAEKLRIHA